jgi:hypothetical protein
LEPFARDVGLIKKRSGHVSSGSSEALREARGNRIAFEINRYEGSGPNDAFGDLQDVRSDDNENTSVESDKLSGEAWHPVASSIGIPFVNHKILA